MATHDQPVLYSVDFTGCTEIPRTSPDEVAVAFALALERAGATVVHRASRQFSGKGLTCVLILAESHAVLHTWPETGTVNLDIFSCSARLNSLAAIVELGRSYGASNVSVQEISRADGHSPAAVRSR